MQYDLDLQGEFAPIFKIIREILLSYSNIKELKNAKQTSYSDEYGVVAMMRRKGNTFVVAFGKGVKLQNKYPFLLGSGKIVRHLYFQSIEDVNEPLFRNIIEDSFILNMEAYELKELKKLCKGVKSD